MSTSHEIKLNPMGFSVLNMQLLDIVVAGGHILSPEKAVASVRLARPLLEKVRAARNDGSPMSLGQKEMDYLTPLLELTKADMNELNKKAD